MADIRRGRSVSWVCVEDDVAAFDSGTDIARFNAVAAPTAAAAPRVVGMLAEALAARTDWFSLHKPVPCSHALRDIAHGLQLIEEQEPLMLLGDSRHLVAAANTTDAQTSRLGPDQIERHVDVWARGFGVPAEALTPWLGSDLLYRPNVMAYQASLDGVDVATALGIVADGFVGVFNVACVANHRRRGYGAALTAKVVLDGLSSGADMAVLRLGDSMVTHGIRIRDRGRRHATPAPGRPCARLRPALQGASFRRLRTCGSAGAEALL